MSKAHHAWPRVNRRTVLQGTAGVALALPFLESIDRRAAAAQQLRDGGPRRLFVLSQVQGWVVRDAVPDPSFNLPPVLSPLDPIKHKILVLNGIDNRIAGGHNPTQRSQFTGRKAYGANQYASDIYASGPSIDEVIANRIAAGGPRRRLDITHLFGSDANLQPQDSPFFWHGDASPVTGLTNPHDAFARVFGAAGDGSMPAPQLDRLRLRRRSVLDTVLGQFNSLQARVSADDRVRLDAHAEQVRRLEQSLADMPAPSSLANCSERPTLPDVSDHRSIVPEISNALIDIAVLATACGVSDVVTTLLWEGQYQWLGSTLVNEEIAASEGRYHLLFHKFGDGRDFGRPREAVNVVNRWYASLFARYLQGLDAISESDGSTALDHTLAVWVPEFGNGAGHAPGNLPCVLAGNLAGVSMGRFVGFAEDLDSSYGGDARSQTNHQLLVSILNAFGDASDGFGDYSLASVPRGGLVGL